MRRIFSTGQLFGVGLCVAVLGCGAPPEGVDVNERASEPERETALAVDTTPISVREVLENPSGYGGKRITIGGEIVDVWSPHAFTLASHEFLANDSLLVIASTPLWEQDAMARQPNHGDIVRVTGTVRLGALENLERELGINVRAGVQALAAAKGLVLVADRVAPAR